MDIYIKVDTHNPHVDGTHCPSNETRQRRLPLPHTTQASICHSTFGVGPSSRRVPTPTPPPKVLIYPEESAKDAVTLTEEECDRLDEKEFLNDSLVDYELKRIQAAALQPCSKC